MKLVREHIFEKFTEDSDPIKDMGIGLPPIIREIIKDQNAVFYKLKEFLKDDENYLLEYYYLLEDSIKINRQIPLLTLKLYINKYSAEGTLTFIFNYKTQKTIVKIKAKSLEERKSEKDQWENLEVPDTFEELYEHILNNVDKAEWYLRELE